jgi:hypothetical protein
MINNIKTIVYHRTLYKYINNILIMQIYIKILLNQLPDLLWFVKPTHLQWVGCKNHLL